jgi:transposase
MKTGVVAALYGVHRSTLWRWREQLSCGHGLEAGHSPGGPRKIDVAQHPALAAQLGAASDATLEEHMVLWHQQQGQLVSRATMARAIVRVGWTRKKRV